MSTKKILVFILRLDAVVLCLALLAVFMPTEWMAATHEGLGMGRFPENPLVGYLTRTVASLYFLRGVLVGFVSFDVDRYLPIIVLLGLGTLFFGVLVFGVDLWVGMPLFWTLGEGPPLVVFGSVVVGLAWKRSRELA